MTQLKDKLQNALDESRILILGVQVLIGFQFRSIFETGFEKLPVTSRYLKTGGLILLLFALILLLWSAAYHRIVEEGNETERLHRFTSRVMTVAVLPFAVTLGIDFYTTAERLEGGVWAAAGGAAATGCALFFWYGLEFLHRKPSRKSSSPPQSKPSDTPRTPLKYRIRHVLTEARMVLPGVQTLLGFQFITMLMESFDRLPRGSQQLHLAALAMTMLSMILLMTPPAYHRIVERGEETEEFHRFAGRMLLAAMIPLAAGVSCDLFVVLQKVTGATAFSVVAAGVMFSLFVGLWFGFTCYRRSRLR